MRGGVPSGPNIYCPDLDARWGPIGTHYLLPGLECEVGSHRDPLFIAWIRMRGGVPSGPIVLFYLSGGMV